MTITNGYCTLAQYKAWIAVRGQDGVVPVDASDDTSMEILIEGASRYIDQQTGMRFWAPGSDETRYFTAVDPYCLEIDELSAAPTSVSVDYTGGLRSYTALASTDYDLTPDNALLEGKPYTQIEINPVYAAYFPTTRRGVKVVGKFGFPSVPHDVREATLMIVQNSYSQRTGQASSGRISVTSSGLVIRPEDVPPFAMSVIESYRMRT